MQPDIQVPVLLLYVIKRTAGKLQLRSQVPDQILITLIGKAYRSGLEKFRPSCYKLINNSNTFLNGGDGVMKKLFSCLAILGGVFGIVSYLNKYGLPILGNLTMHIPIKMPFDFWDIFTKGIEVAEGKINL